MADEVGADSGDGFAGGDSLALAPELNELPRAAGWLEALANRDGLPEAVLFKLQLGLEEALVNVLSYAFPAEGKARAQIRLDYARATGLARLRITDNGVPFDPTCKPDVVNAASIEEAEVGGHGIQLMRHLLDEFSYCHVDGNNRLILGTRLDTAG
ncbi:ATP-binding protein [Ancylobacter sp. 6x-1]|uniref:ATP-binding protein n=1 Tax=Ancylobacter crimeensis TaxID=2579147 RepID=A0ABT0DBK1_9HYPH|nr:ATP-binding protein [Ancylobacter crimeensis]MCK0197333.1 ATP-binding protein [Ancylobacter crimeensis]